MRNNGCDSTHGMGLLCSTAAHDGIYGKHSTSSASSPHTIRSKKRSTIVSQATVETTQRAVKKMTLEMMYRTTSTISINNVYTTARRKSLSKALGDPAEIQGKDLFVSLHENYEATDWFVVGLLACSLVRWFIDWWNDRLSDGLIDRPTTTRHPSRHTPISGSIYPAVAAYSILRDLTHTTRIVQHRDNPHKTCI